MIIKTTAKSCVEIEALTWKDTHENVILPIGTVFDLMLLPSKDCLSIEIERCPEEIPPAYFRVVGSDSNRRDITEFEINPEILEEIQGTGLSIASSKNLPGQIFDDETGGPSRPFESLKALHADKTPELNPLALKGYE